MQNIQIGSTGTNVKLIQKALNITVDGDFGSQTQAAVEAFQTAHGLVADGVVGPLTWAALGLGSAPVETGVQGLDVSHWDGIVDWVAAKAAGIQFGFAKATEGDSIIDDQFDRNWSGMKAAGIVRGAYHFFHPAQDPVKCANNFLRTVGPLVTGDMLVLDWETHEGSIAQELAAAQMWLQVVEAATAKKPIIYIGKYYANDLGNPAWLASYPLWLAEYSSQANVPAPWSGYTFWQYTESGSVAGVSGSCDLNVAGGDLAWLTEFAG